MCGWNFRLTQEAGLKYVQVLVFGPQRGDHAWSQESDFGKNIYDVGYFIQQNGNMNFM